MSEINTILNSIDPMDVRAELFRHRDFNFIVSGYNEDGHWVTHKKQKEAFELLTSGDYEEILYGGAAGGAKTFTGCAWLLFMCYLYPETRWFVARNELKDIIDSVLVTFMDVCKRYGFSDYKYNAVKNFIQFGNGSHINLIEIKRKPRDPMFEDLGSTEYTGGWIEEVGEIDERGATVLTSRVGRYKNTQYKINPVVLYTCNPKKNWAKSEFYDKWLAKTLEIEKYYLPCLLTENPFAPKSYVKKMKRLAEKDKALYERLFKGNWEYEDNPYQLCDQEMIEAIFSNELDHGKRYITVDAARFGSDKAVIGVWEGWVLVEVLEMAISKTTEIDAAIMHLRRKYRVPRTRCVCDADGIGAGVVDGSRVKAFHNGARPIYERGLGVRSPNYKNLQVQCLFKLADKINEAGILIKAALSKKQIADIKQELAQIQRKGDFEPDRKLDCKSKEDIKADIGRSPDYRDMMLMRVYFDLKKSTTDLQTTWN